jgi:hypothetical protein
MPRKRITGARAKAAAAAARRKRNEWRRRHYTERGLVRLSGSGTTAIDAAKDRDLVQQALAEFGEVTSLSDEPRERLVADLGWAGSHARGGINARKRDHRISTKAFAGDIFLNGVRRALEQAGLQVTRWSKRYDRGDGPENDAPESFYFKLAHKIAGIFGIPLPEDLKPVDERAAKIQYGMSEAMKAAQDAELRRLG